MPVVWWGLVGLFAAALINRAADCWLSPARLQCGLTRHPAREAVMWIGLPALFMTVAWRNPAVDELWPIILMMAVFILLAVIDLEQRRVPNIIVLPAIGLALIYATQRGQLFTAVAAAGFAFVVFLTLHVIGRRIFGPGALGMGDVKLATLIGAVTGMEWVLVALLGGILLAGLAAAILLLSGRARRDHTLAYGTYLGLAAVAVLWVGF